jgi:hypothetical protein
MSISSITQPCYWLVSGRIPYDDDDTLFSTLTPCTKAEAEAQFREIAVSDALASYPSSHDLRRRMDNIAPDQPLTDGVIVVAFACSRSPIYTE